MANERTTEDIVREHLKRHGTPDQRVEEQSSAHPAIRRALATRSKSGPGIGKPEFIVSFPTSHPKLVIVVECKADLAKHESARRNRPADFAVDGVLHYAAALARTFDVIAIAVSGTVGRQARISTFRQLRQAGQAEELPSPHGPVNTLLPVDKYRQLLTFDPAVRARTEAELISFSRDLHNYMRDYAKLSEAEKPLIVSAILLALKDTSFKRAWSDYGPRHLAREMFSAIERTARDADIEERKREVMLAPYIFVKTHPEVIRPTASGETRRERGGRRPRGNSGNPK